VTAGSGDGAAAALIATLTRRGQTLAVAESLTGGLVAAALTEVPGASAVFRGAVVAYATDLKAALLGVDAAVLAEHGAVSPDVAGAMATGVRARLGATFGLATTGVAGPDAAEGKPVGTVYIAASSGEPGRPGGQTQVRHLALHGNRDDIRGQTVAQVLALLLVIVGEETR
jgi:nicotinamide-nucleotide amidase